MKRRTGDAMQKVAWNHSN